MVQSRNLVTCGERCTRKADREGTGELPGGLVNLEPTPMDSDLDIPVAKLLESTTHQCWCSPRRSVGLVYCQPLAFKGATKTNCNFVSF